MTQEIEDQRLLELLKNKLKDIRKLKPKKEFVKLNFDDQLEHIALENRMAVEQALDEFLLKVDNVDPQAQHNSQQSVHSSAPGLRE